MQGRRLREARVAEAPVWIIIKKVPALQLFNRRDNMMPVDAMIRIPTAYAIILEPTQCAKQANFLHETSAL